jgi:hypothetical protein
MACQRVAGRQWFGARVLARFCSALRDCPGELLTRRVPLLALLDQRYDQDREKQQRYSRGDEDGSLVFSEWCGTRLPPSEPATASRVDGKQARYNQECD